CTRHPPTIAAYDNW
nr:immunoglobulin heavy chain junction region [Macaca mulatta]